MLQRAKDQDLECLCVLMKIIGKVLEEKTESSEKHDIAEYFRKMDEIVNKEKTSADISIMWKEVLLLKNNGWIPTVGPTAESRTKNIQPEESNMIVQSGDQTVDQFSLPKNDLTTVPLVEEKGKNIAAETIEDVKILSSNIDNSSNDITTITYEEGQWSPVNPLGKKKYRSTFLCSLRYSPLSMKNPELTVKADCVLPYDLDRIVSGKNKKTTFLSPLIKKNLKLEKEISQIAVILDKSKETETPARNSSEIMENLEEQIPEMEVEECKKLKKTTEEIIASLESTNSDEVALKIMKLQIINEYHLKTVVNAIFEQAVKESRISDIFAGLSSYLNYANFGWQAMKEGDPNDNLKKSLLECFQKEFQKNSIQAALSLFRLRGVTSFFGQLYKIGMITDPILVMGMKILLNCGDDYSLEMLCNLISQRKPYINGRVVLLNEKLFRGEKRFLGERCKRSDRMIEKNELFSLLQKKEQCILSLKSHFNLTLPNW
ncbi:hypothetical protein J437_LFUL005197 [Ladona fulva]|uniref:MIF4G domain-containing protein n=1 Tax=Ladona fulva TaxID=123851 RepID=A0A8K0NWC6_LADFU|nr:hypothetical protein J437_LFUL005197 [Ladona fulva]